MSLLSNEHVLSAQFLAGIETLNFQEEEKVELIFLRLADYETKVRSESEPGCAFTDVEKQKLVSVLSNVNSAEQVESILATLTTIINESVYFVAKPNLLHSRLVQLSLREDLAVNIAKNWTSKAQGLVSAERKRSVRISGPRHLNNVDYSINGAADEPTAVFQFDVSSDCDGDRQRFNVEMNAEELYKFYQQLETIQMKLDALK